MQNRVYVICVYVCMDEWMVRMPIKSARGGLFSPKNTAF